MEVSAAREMSRLRQKNSHYQVFRYKVSGTSPCFLSLPIASVIEVGSVKFAFVGSSDPDVLKSARFSITLSFSFFIVLD